MNRRNIPKHHTPFQCVRIDDPNGFSYCGETVSLPTPEGTIMVRRVPGDPTTMEAMPLDRILPMDWKPRLVHYAEVYGSGSFPTDMLRYDFACPVNFRITEDYPHWEPIEGAEPAPVRERPNSRGLIIATVSRQGRSSNPWCSERWRSFMWSVKELRKRGVNEE